MNELENIVKSVVYGGIGAAATIVEKGGDIARVLVEKGQETIRSNQDTADDIKRRVKEFCDKFQNDDVIDVSKLSAAQRAELRRQLDALDAAEAEAAAAASVVDEVPAGAEPAEAPVSDDDVPVYEPEEATYTAEDEL
ncbi:MAG: hypothetical protein IJZ74_03375 [Clostridia bacterium]|nr:hypothetical protein [Clostridia bacterium]